MRLYQYVEVVGPVWTETVAEKLAWLPRVTHPGRGLPPNRLGAYARPEFEALYRPEGLQWLPIPREPLRTRQNKRGDFVLPDTAAITPAYDPSVLSWLPSNRQPIRVLARGRLSDFTLDPAPVSAPSFDPQTLDWNPRGAIRVFITPALKESITIIDPDALIERKAGYYYEDKPRRRKVIIDGLTYLVTAREEAELLKNFIDSIEKRMESIAQPRIERKQKSKKATAQKRESKQSEKLKQRLDRLKIHQALLVDEMRREASMLSFLAANQRRANEIEDEAIALILALA